MVGGRSIKELISLTKRAARNIRQSLDEIAEELINHQQQRQPLLARVPVSRSLKQYSSLRGGYIRPRNYSTFTRQQSIRYASTFIRPNYVARTPLRTQQTLKQLWSFSSFKQLSSIGGNTISRGVFPSTLYANFVKTNSRNYSSYTNFTQQAVKNLNQSIRAFILQSKDESLKKRSLSSRYGMNYSTAYANEVYQMARTNSSFDEFEFLQNCFVDFNLNSMKFSIPSMTFIDDEILQDLSLDFESHELHLKQIFKEVELIKTQFGSLPISLERNGSILRIHFTNCDYHKVEMLLRDIGVTKGVIHEIDEPSTSTTSLTTTTTTSLQDLESPILSTTDDSASQLSSSYCDQLSDILTDDYFPVLQMSDPLIVS